MTLFGCGNGWKHNIEKGRRTAHFQILGMQNRFSLVPRENLCLQCFFEACGSIRFVCLERKIPALIANCFSMLKAILKISEVERFVSLDN